MKWPGGTVARPALVGIIGGSTSDFPVLEKARGMLHSLGVACELLVVSAHRTPDRMFEYAEQAEGRGLEVIIAGAGGAAHLPGMIAAKTHLPVIGVPIPTEPLRGLDSLLSIVQMPRGVPVATVAIGGAENAALLAARILALKYPLIRERVLAFRADQTAEVLRNAQP
ncbi:MAG: 5-(carboxyamino)imidazole ribonucleotide mutase [Nitrospiria bacterium]